MAAVEELDGGSWAEVIEVLLVELDERIEGAVAGRRDDGLQGGHRGHRNGGEIVQRYCLWFNTVLVRKAATDLQAFHCRPYCTGHLWRSLLRGS